MTNTARYFDSSSIPSIETIEIGQSIAIFADGARKPWIGTVSSKGSKTGTLELTGRRGGSSALVRNVHSGKIYHILQGKSALVATVEAP